MKAHCFASAGVVPEPQSQVEADTEGQPDGNGGAHERQRSPSPPQPPRSSGFTLPHAPNVCSSCVRPWTGQPLSHQLCPHDPQIGGHSTGNNIHGQAAPRRLRTTPPNQPRHFHRISRNVRPLAVCSLEHTQSVRIPQPNRDRNVSQPTSAHICKPCLFHAPCSSPPHWVVDSEQHSRTLEVTQMLDCYLACKEIRSLPMYNDSN